ncbi:hypothetical protein AMJ86_01040 [bacterium SM23_57]|nr:MAG: hypothetical protein AMJ86_01040 [bacterium SM23_57]
MKLRLLLLALFVFPIILSAQILTWNPLFVTEDDSITIVYDATKGNGGLKAYKGDVYAHTGVITTESVAPWDWKHVKTEWGQNTAETKLERIDDDLYRFEIKPSIRQYYGILPNEQVLELAFVFRSAAQPFLEGKTESGGDIFLPLRSGINILSPSQQPFFASLNEPVPIVAISSPETRLLKLFVDDSLITQVQNDTLAYTLIANEYGKKVVNIVAENEMGPYAEKSFYFVVNEPVSIEEIPPGIIEGINYIDDSTVTLCLFAPNKDFVYVIGDFGDWEVEPEYYMKLTPDRSRYWLTLTGLEAQKEYLFQYLVDGKLRIADPYTEKISDPWYDRSISDDIYPNLVSYPTGKTSEITSILQTNPIQYSWEITDFQRPALQDLVIYELLIRDFIQEHDYKTLIDTLGYFERLGINAIELMPITEFEGNESWGYTSSFYFAPDKYYGPKNDLKRFIDECHKRGIAVILDMVLNHSFGQSPLVRLYSQGAYGPPTPENPWYNVTATHPYSVGYDFNHESRATQALVDRVNGFWLKEYHVDGYRFDLAKGFTQTYSGTNVDSWGRYDASRIAILKRMADQIWTVDSTAYIILEHFAENREEKELVEHGMMIWGNLNIAYSQSAMAWLEDPEWNSDLSWGYFKARGWTKPHLVTYMESHDEPYLMYKNLQWGRSHATYNIQHLATALDRIKLVAAFFFTLPGPKMMWQFGELGYDQYLPESGYERIYPKPILWNYYQQPERKCLYETIAALIKLRNEHEIFRNPESVVQLQVGQGQYGRRINISNDSLNVTIIGNFGVMTLTVNPKFQKIGEWHDYFSGDTLQVTNTQEPIQLAAGEFHIYSDVELEISDEPSGIEKAPTVKFKTFMLEQNCPNPFNPKTTIRYQLARPVEVTLEIYNLCGQKVRTLVRGKQSVGHHTAVWDGSTDVGRNASSGLYLYRLQAGDFVQTRKMMLIR